MEIIIRNSIKYQLDTEDNTAKVIGYISKPVNVKIPEFIDYKNEKYKVTEIGDSVFNKCNSLETITIPDSVTYIGSCAFYYCINLETIIIPNGVTTIGDWAFKYCSSLTSITIPDSITKIGDMTFAYCRSLKSIDIPNSVTYIGHWLFAHCDNLKYINIGNSVTVIKEWTFCDCKSLTSITIPNNVTKISSCAFDNCQSLKSVIIPNSVTYIGEGAFYKCHNLTSITIGNSVSKIGDSAFSNIGLTLPKRYTEDGKLIAYKAFNVDMTCRNFQYEEGKSYEKEGEIKLCNRGFHACTNPLDIFSYYSGQIGKDIYIHEVYLSGTIDEEDLFATMVFNDDDSKVCASKIEIGRRLSLKDINEIINSKYQNKKLKKK